jgi:hypothetical protein
LSCCEINDCRREAWRKTIGVKFDVLLYDLTSTYFETDEDRGPADLRQYGYSRDKRGDCRPCQRQADKSSSR